MKYKDKQLFWLTLAIIVCSALFLYLTREKPVAVKLHTIQTGLVKSTVSNTRVGTIKACRRAFLAPAAGGQVALLNVKEGDKVAQQQTLLEVWNADLKAQVALQKAKIKVQEATTRQACYTAQGAEREAKRLQRLSRKNQLISAEKVDVAVTDAQAKRAGCQAAEAAVKVSLANLQVSLEAVERTLVKAPFDGVVAEVNAELGEYVTPSPPGIPTLPPIDLIDNSCLYISAPIDEVDAPQIKLGMTACVSLDAFKEQRCSGKVRRIAPYVLEKEKQARTVEVEVLLQDEQETSGLLPGYSADIEVLVDSKTRVLRVPTEAVLDGNKVLILAQSGTIEERKFSPGLNNWRFTEVLSGLQKGDALVLSVGMEGVEAGVKAVGAKQE
ncbi:MAG: efflux RND transporter periplasmic adaptor subunit [Methylococcaceae bacterium]